MTLSKPDLSTASNYTDFKTTHLSLEFTPNFERCTIAGVVMLSMKRLNSQAKTLILDTRFLQVHNVFYQGAKESISFTMRSVPLKFTEALVIELPDLEPSFEIRIEYTVTPSTSAVQWLSPEQTLGKKKPFLYTQLENIHARAMFPCQDTPSIKATYVAKVHVPDAMVPVMSAILVRHDKDNSTYEFKQDIPIPAYLVALAIGDLASRKIGPRSTVYAEPSIVDKAAKEFEDTEEFIAVAEDLTTPYVWGNYDILVLPLGFPNGGMENPCLTFVTPALLTGDKSLVDVIAHEISHSWTGNLVTNATWEDFWLNEGFTMYLERKILGRVHGERERHFSALIGLGELKEAVNAFGKDHKFTAMVPDLRGSHPDDAFSVVPYEKGHTLLFHMETVFGTELMDGFMKSYISHFSRKSLSTEEWKSFVYDYFKDHQEYLDKIDWDMWFYGKNMPTVIPAYDDTMLREARELAHKWLSGDAALYPTSPSVFERLSAWQKAAFMDTLHDDPGCTSKTLAAIDASWKFSDCTTTKNNAEIEYRWLRLALDANYYTEDIERAFKRFVSNNGRLKYIRPVYRSLAKTLSGSKTQLAIDEYRKNMNIYHPIARDQIEKDLGLSHKSKA